MQAPGGYTIYYTTDGSIPTVHSYRYKRSITVDPRKNLNKDILYIPTSLIWRPPFDRQNHCTTVRARCFKNGEGYGKVRNIIYSAPNISLHQGFQVVHLLLEADSLFSNDKGIYVMGEKYYSKKKRIIIDQFENREGERKYKMYPANYLQRGRKWTRSAEFILMDLSGKTLFEQSIKLCIHGNFTRTRPLKSLRVMADSIRGDAKLHYPFFDDLPYNTFKRILLRNSGNDVMFTMFKDAMLQQTVKELNLDSQGYTPAVVYINGNYWGIHNIREKLDENYLAVKYGSALDEIEIIEYGVGMNRLSQLGIYFGNEQSLTSFKELINYILENSMADEEVYQKVCAQMDIKNFIDYMIVETFYANTDWASNNIKAYRIGQQSKTMIEKNIDAGKWKWLLFDLDFCMPDGPSINMFDRLRYDESAKWFLMNESDEHFITPMFFRLLDNSQFKEKFLMRYEYVVRNYLTVQNILQQIEDFEERYQVEMERHIARWRYPKTMQEWRDEVEEMKTFARKRPEIVLKQIKSLNQKDAYRLPKPYRQTVFLRKKHPPACILKNPSIYRHVPLPTCHSGTTNRNPFFSILPKRGFEKPSGARLYEQVYLPRQIRRVQVPTLLLHHIHSRTYPHLK